MSRRVPLLPPLRSPSGGCSTRTRPGRRDLELVGRPPALRADRHRPVRRTESDGHRVRRPRSRRARRRLDRPSDLDAPHTAALPTCLVGDPPRRTSCDSTRSGFHRTTERSACRSARRSTPSSVTFCTSQSSRSPFGIATANVNGSARGRLGDDLARGLQGQPRAVQTNRRGSHRPPPSVTLTRSPSRSRNTRRR